MSVTSVQAAMIENKNTFHDICAEPMKLSQPYGRQDMQTWGIFNRAIQPIPGI